MVLKCCKFEFNIFNKLKCQVCFGVKDVYFVEVLYNNKVRFFFLIYNVLCDIGVYIYVCIIVVFIYDICKICGVYLLLSVVCLINGYLQIFLEYVLLLVEIKIYFIILDMYVG